jgi:hypothetical protein
MSGILNFGARAQEPNKLGSVQVSTSEFGVAIPVVIGTNVLPLKLLDYVNFYTRSESSVQGGKGGDDSGYEYYASTVQLVCEGPCDGIGDIITSGGASQLIGTTEQYTISGNNPSYGVQHGGTAFFYDEGVTYAGTYTAEVNDYGSDGLTQISGFDTLPMQKVTGNPGALQYSLSPTGTYSFSAADAGKAVTIGYSYTATPTHTSTGETAEQNTPAQYLKYTIFNGTRPQTPWGYLSSNYPTHALPYAGKVLMVNPNLDLGTSATVPSFTVEVLNGAQLSFGSGITDCDPAQIITAILTNSYWGARWPYLGDTTQLSNYCVANGLFFSAVYDTTTQTSSVLNDLISLCNSEFVWSWDGTLKCIPYGDTSVVGFGRTYTPNTQPIFAFTDDDFIVGQGEEPVTIDIPDLADVNNYYKIEFLNRANTYNVETLDDMNQADIDVYGLRSASTTTAHQITTPDVAQLVLNAICRRGSYPFKNHKWKLNQCFPNLEPMDIVTLTRPQLGLNAYPVRIKHIEEDADTGVLSFEAEDFPWGIGQPVEYPRTVSGGGIGPGATAFPGSVVTPIIFEASTRISKSGNSEIWIGLAGQSANWGGCYVYLSTDNVNYQQVGIQSGAARMGVSLGAIPATADPDTTFGFDIEIYQNSGVQSLTSATQADADQLLTLCYFDGEYIAYSTVTDVVFPPAQVHQIGGTAPGGVSNTGVVLGNYIRRGQLGTLNVAHAAYAPFLRLDNAVFVYESDQTLIGKTLYFKFCSFNLLQGMTQNLSDVNPYPYQYSGLSINQFIPVLNTMMISSILNSGSTGAEIVISVAAGATAGIYAVYGNDYALPSTTLAGPFGFSTTYFVNWGPHGGYVTYTDEAQALDDRALGYIPIGSVVTVASSGSGGTSGGGGTSGAGTTGGGGNYGGGTGYTCTVYGTMLDGPQGPVSNVDVERMVNAGERVYLVGRNIPERVRSAAWNWVEQYQEITVGETTFCCSDSHTLSVAGVHRHCSAVDDGALVEIRGGYARLSRTKRFGRVRVLRIELEGPSHEYSVGGVLTHNEEKAAS